MKKSDSEFPQLSQQLKWFEQIYQGRKERVEELLKFPLTDLPRTQLGVVDGHPVDRFEDTIFTLQNGEEVLIDALHQYRSYEGFLEGTPHPYWAINSALDALSTHYPFIKNDPVVLAPVLSQGTWGESEGFEAWIVLPPVCSIAIFKQNDFFVTRLAAVIWFQDKFGLNLDERTKKQVSELSWSDISMELDCY